MSHARAHTHRARARSPSLVLLRRVGERVDGLLGTLLRTLGTSLSMPPDESQAFEAVHLHAAQLVYVLCTQFAHIKHANLKALLGLTNEYANAIDMRSDRAEKARHARPPALPPTHPRTQSTLKTNAV